MPGPGPVLLAGGSVVSERGPERADVLVIGGRIATVGPSAAASSPTGATILDCTGRYVLPGFVDAHSHAGSLLVDEGVQLALLRQGVTTIITGQDGVSPAPGDGSWADTYFAVIDGPHPGYDGTGIAGLLRAADGTAPVNVATLVPAGTVRHEVMGPSPTRPTADQLDRMRRLVRQGLADGAVGLATGLDYVPGLHADAEELTALAREVAAVDGVYVSHMRGGYEANVRAGLDEIAAIVRGSGVRAHVSHLHAPADLALAALDDVARDTGRPFTFDAYPYSRGCTILSMLLLPAEVAAPGTTGLAGSVSTPGGRQAMRRAIVERVLGRADLGEGWADQITLSHVAAPGYRDLQGVTLANAAARIGTDPASFAIDVLVASELQVTAILRVPQPRSPEDLAPLYRHAGHMGGSDGIFVGTHPHPRAAGTFARYLGDLVRPGLLDWADAVTHLSTRAVRTHRLGARGTVAAGAVADLVVVDPETVAARSTYTAPRRLAVGIDDVLVAGVPVLADGALTGATPGRGLRRA
jgi:N-acyl-D-amino-acid deacylase